MNGYNIFFVKIILAFFILFISNSEVLSSHLEAGFPEDITPNDFEGTDTERIHQAVEAAKGTTNSVRIPAQNANGTHIWMIDSAILLPSNMKMILDNCTLKLSDESRDNMFRSDNVGIGIADPVWNENISIIGIGDVTLRGADNPRSTGDGARALTLNPEDEQKKGNWRVSYGSDAGKDGLRQNGDWRNIMVLIGYVKGFKLKNVNFDNAHAWTISFERTLYAEISDLTIHNQEFVEVDGKRHMTSNKDGINLRQVCKYFRIDNISGVTGDDFIALSNLDTNPDVPKFNGDITSTMVTSSRWYGPGDDIEQITITNISCENRYRAIAIRASDEAGIHHVFVNGLFFNAMDDRHDAILLGGKGYGKMSQPGKINNIYAMNVMGNGHSLVRIEAPVRDCHFMNGMYYGENENPTLYTIEKKEVEGVSENNWIKAK